MNTTKRLLKRHKRQVARDRNRVKVSAPDVRTPEQIQAAREATRPNGGRGKGPLFRGSPPVRNQPVHSVAGSAKTDT